MMFSIFKYLEVTITVLTIYQCVGQNSLCLKIYLAATIFLIYLAHFIYYTINHTVTAGTNENSDLKILIKKSILKPAAQKNYQLS